MQLIMVVMTMFAVMLYRVAVIVSMYETTKGTVLSGYASLITSLTASVINLIAIVILNQVSVAIYRIAHHSCSISGPIALSAALVLSAVN